MPGELAEHHLGARRERPQPPRPELHHRRGLRLDIRRRRRGRRPPRRGARRRRPDRRRRPEHGPVHVREVLQDRGALGHRHAPVRRRRRRLRHGGGLRGVPPEAARRRRAGRGPGLRRDPRRRRLERREGKGNHRPEPGRPAPRHRAGVEGRRARPGDGDARRGARHEHEGRRRRRGGEPCGDLRRRAEGLDRPRLGEEQRRPPEGGRRRGGAAEGDPGDPPQAASSDAQRREAEPEHRLRGDAVLPEPRPRRVEDGRRRAAGAPASRPTASAGPTSTSFSRSTSRER